MAALDLRVAIFCVCFYRYCIEYDYSIKKIVYFCKWIEKTLSKDILEFKKRYANLVNGNLRNF